MKNERNILSTELLYETDSYLKEFTATVLSCDATTYKEVFPEDKENAEKELYAVCLDRTAFFPEGGGQKADTGVIDGIRVLDVQRINGEVIHYTASALAEGNSVLGKIDFETRFLRMQNHSGEHLLCGIIHNNYGYDNVGFHISDDVLTIDIDGYLTPEELSKMEELANKAVYENVPITISFPEEGELEKIDFRSKLELTEGVRLVTIEGYDVCACCAPHVDRTGEIGLIKIVNSFKHRGGTRIEIKAGKLAYNDYVGLDKDEKSLMDILSVKRGEASEAAERLSEKCKALSAENSALKKQITDMIISATVSGLKQREENDLRPELIFTDTMDEVQLRNLINACVEVFSGIVAGFMRVENAESESYRFLIRKGDSEKVIKLTELAKKMREDLSAKGGGSEQMIQGNIVLSEKEIRDYFYNCYNI